MLTVPTLSYSFFSLVSPKIIKIPKCSSIDSVFTPYKAESRSITRDVNMIEQHTFPEMLHYLHEEKLKEVRLTFNNVAEKDELQILVMIDALQRLGIDYHFKREIALVLEQQYIKSMSHINQDCDLFVEALRFRLMRQEGYNVREDVFMRYKDKNGEFRPELREDIKGLMSFFEASQLVMEEETLLHEAKYYSERILNDFARHRSDDRQARLVKNTLLHPHHKSLAIFNAEDYLRVCNGENYRTMNLICNLAKIDSSIVRCVRRKEVLQVAKWWDDLGLSNELKFARNQPVKMYLWPAAMLDDPNLSEHKVDLAKPISMIYVIDDIFDVYGTFDELALFTDVVNRWDYEEVERLPDYMKICFNALNKITDEISSKILMKYGWNPTESLRKSWATLCKAFLVEAKWFASGEMPKAEEYLRNGIISSGVHIGLVHLFFLLGENINASNVKLLNDDNLPSIVESTAKIVRLWNDLGTAKDENQDGKDGSYLDCYIKEHENQSIGTAKEKVNIMISEAWMRLNQEAFSSSSHFSETFKRSNLNIARMVPLIYDENHHPKLENHIKSLLY